MTVRQRPRRWRSPPSRSRRRIPRRRPTLDMRQSTQRPPLPLPSNPMAGHRIGRERFQSRLGRREGRALPLLRRLCQSSRSVDRAAGRACPSLRRPVQRLSRPHHRPQHHPQHHPPCLCRRIDRFLRSPRLRSRAQRIWNRRRLQRPLPCAGRCRWETSNPINIRRAQLTLD